MQTFFIIVLLALEGVVLCWAYSDWRKDRRLKAVRRMERELAETQQRLSELSTEHQAWLQGQALEARKALIAESFRASQAQRDKCHDRR